jgi:hypothetical protein
MEYVVDSCLCVDKGDKQPSYQIGISSKFGSWFLYFKGKQVVNQWTKMNKGSWIVVYKWLSKIIHRMKLKQEPQLYVKWLVKYSASSDVSFNTVSVSSSAQPDFLLML